MKQALAALTKLADGIAILVSNLSSGQTMSADEYRAEHPELDEAFFAANGTAWYFGQDYYQMLEAAEQSPEWNGPSCKLTRV